MNDPVTLTLLGLAGTFILLLLHVPVGIAMGIAGVVGFAALAGPSPALAMIASEVAITLSSLDLLTIPLFIMMGAFANVAGLSEDLYRLAYALIGHRRGGLAAATISGCAGFGAVCGSSVATTATFGWAALPSMRKRGYEPGFSAATVAAGGTMGTLIPPSSAMVVYAVLAQELIITMYIAALLPALLAVLMHYTAIAVYSRRYPLHAPIGQKATIHERIHALVQSWQVILLVFIVVGGMVGGAFTATEAAAVGAAIAFVFAWMRGALTLAGLRRALTSTASTSAMIYVLLIGASLFGYFAAVTQTPRVLVEAVEGSSIPIWAAMCLILLVFIVAGAFFDELAAMVIAMPFALPLVISWGFDPVWWGLINIVIIEIGQLTPPLGMNVFVVHGVAPDIPFSKIYRGVVPYLVSSFLRLGILMAFPMLVLWLPSVLS